MIGLVGIVAEALDDDPSYEGWFLIGSIEFGIEKLSDTGPEMAGDFSEADIDECLSLLRTLWPSVELAATLEGKSFLASLEG
ncbi:hypothetical protein AWB79_01274 [Caballeronia hypogeia]|uniref:Uncharacterized protein n=2 Tax=Caballeronia hypogeia TaxID=1777140 RepID=A0A157ZS09_9BURK|nr:hypothetical protein AWB79_01274 [Caballeronia hypogeia]